MTRRGRWAAATAVAVLLLCDVICFAMGREWCKDDGCCYNSESTYNATQLNCSSSKPWISIALKGSPILEDVRITQSNKIFFKGDAVANSNKLRSVLFYEIQELILDSNSKVQVEADRDVSLTVRQVGFLRLKMSAFSGWQSALATVSIADAAIVYIEMDAFPASSSFRRIRFSNIASLTLETGAIRSTVSRLELENIHLLQLRPNAIRGTIETLSLRNVTASSCPPLAIGGSIDFVSLHSVTLTNLELRCLDAKRRWKRLTLTDSRLGHMSRRSIHGVIDNVSISGCEIDSVCTGAVSVSVIQLNMSTSTVSVLEPFALQVDAIRSISLHRVSVTHLRPYALIGLQVDNITGGGGGGGISVRRLSVEHTEPGSLRFADGVSVTLEDLLLPGGCVCRSPSWSRQLLLGPFGSDEDGLSSDEGGPSPHDEDSLSGSDRDGPLFSDGLATERDTLLRQVEAALCTVGGDSISLSDFAAQNCGGAGDVSGQTQPDGCSAPLASWWLYLGVVALVALLLTWTVLLVIVASKCRRQRQGKRLERPESAGAAGEGLCSTGGPADVGGQPGSSHYCRLVQSCEQTELQVLYSDVADRLPDDDQRTDRSPPAGGSQQGPLYVNSPKPEQCSCASAGLYSMSDKTDVCSCKPARLSEVEPLYANMPGGERAAEPTGSQTAGAADPTRHHVTQVDTDRAEPPDQTGRITADCPEDLPDCAEVSLGQCPEHSPEYAEVSPGQCPEYSPEYDDVSPGQCPEYSPEYAEVSPGQCPEYSPEYAEISPRSPPDPGPANSTGRHITSIPMVENELYGSVV